MTCIVCGREPDGDGLRVQITRLGDLPDGLEFPEGGVDVVQCGDCWRWLRELAVDPTELLAGEAAEIVAADELEATD